MSLRDLSREQKMYAAAAACGLFVISLFFPWFGSGDVSVDGTDVVPSYWIFLLMALAAGAMLAAEAYDLELPEGVKPVRQAALLTLFPFVITLAIFLEDAGGDRKPGLFLALLVSFAAAALAVWIWRDER